MGDEEMSQTRKFVMMAGVLYLVWVIATWMLEGRTGLTLRPDPIGRAEYVLIANVGVGIVLAVWVLHSFVSTRNVVLDQLGFRSVRRTLIAIVIAALVATIVFILQKPRSLDPIVVLNVFSQVLPTSIAEVVVCWAVVGTSFEALTKARGKIVSLLVGILASDLLFGAYHIAHSPPFNQLNMILFLMLPGLVTSLTYFLGRDLYATIVIENAFAMFGVMERIDLAFFTQPLFSIYALAIVSVLVLAVSDKLVLRHTAVA